MMGGYLEFFMEPAVSDMYQCLRRELDELIQKKVLESLNGQLMSWLDSTTC